MLKLVNYALFGENFQVSSYKHSEIKHLLEKHHLQGLEVIQYDDWASHTTLPDHIVGIHMRFWPIWLDFWQGNEDALMHQFGDKEIIRQYYEGEEKQVLINYYRKELQKAQSLGAEYVVFHVCHVELEHCYNYEFTYTDDFVVSAFIELLNESMSGLELSLKVLFENVWWPGFTMRDKLMANRLMTEIQYENKGFMLDVGHLMNSNLDLETEEEAVEYILGVIDNLGELGAYIRGIHLHSSLSGAYVKESTKSPDFEKPFFDRYIESFEHITTIDSHMPFMHPSIMKVINRVNPDYLVFEFAPKSLELLDQYLEEQNKVIS